jgi:myo-inositol 2-dehydrogenase/D-chiro-inositol 1-dehydrogenase
VTTTRVGIVGSGFVASLHAQALQQAPGAEVVAAASPSAEHAFVFARTFGIPHAFIDYRDMLVGDLVDAITVACPNDLHFEVTRAAAAAGKHVLVDKPMAVNLSQCDVMIQACREAQVILMYGENLCFAPKYVRAKQLVEEGALGDVYYARHLECHGGPHAPWFWDVERSGGGVLMDMGCHSIAVCRWLFGNATVESVSAELGTFVHGERTKGDDHSLVTMRFAPTGAGPGAGGGIGVAENSWARPGGLDDRAEVYGSSGLTMADLSRGSALTTYSEPGYGFATEKASSTRGWTFSGFDEVWAEGFQQEMAHFVRCVREGERPLLTGEDGRAVMEIICAAYRSARAGHRVTIPFETNARRPIDLWLAD